MMMYEDPSGSSFTQWLIEISPYVLGAIALAVYFFFKLS